MNPDVRLREFSFSQVVLGFEQHADWGMQGFEQYETKHQRGLSFVMLKPCLSSFFLQKIYHKFDWYSSSLFCFHGSCFALRKQSFEQTGFFNEETFLYGEERYLHLCLLRNKKPRYKAFYDKSQSYIHPVHGRALVVNQAELGLDSYLKTITHFGLNRKKLINQQIRFEYFFYLKSALFGQREKADFYRAKIARLKQAVTNM